MSPVNEWFALLRVHEGGLIQLTDGGQYLNHGRPVAGYLAETFDALIGSEHLALGATDPNRQQRQVCVTHLGQVRYDELDGREVARRAR